jgi:acyl carrier protein
MNIVNTLSTYVVERHLDGRAEVDADTPLLEWGILDSFSIAELLLFIEQNFGVAVPLCSVSPQHFGTLRALAGLLEGLCGERYVATA